MDPHPATETAWELPAPRARTVAVGDVHADLDALLRILMGAGLVDGEGNWAGAGCHLVLVGDLIDRGADSVATMHYVMSLQAQAASSGDRVDALLGNHEMLAAAGDFSYVHADEAESLARFRCRHRHGLEGVFRWDSPWARWTRSRPVVLKVGSTLLAHAGLDSRVLGTTLARLNASAQHWVACLQGAQLEPDRETAWLVDFDGHGPLWSRSLMVGRTPPWHVQRTAQELREVLAHLQADLMVVGHSPTAALDFRIAWPHPYFGQAVALIDTGISRHYRGRLSALEIAHGNTARALYFERGETEMTVTRSWRQAARQALHDVQQSGG